MTPTFQRTQCLGIHLKRALVLVVFFGVLVATVSCPTVARAEDWSAYGDYPDITAAEAIVVDEDGNVLYSRDSTTSMAMASITKVMTAVVALESGVSLDTTYTFTETALAIDPESSVIGYAVGDTATLNDLIHGLLVHSGNDAAMAIAECVAGSESAFVDMMNAKASELGMTGTHFANPHGLDAEGHYSTASDLVTLARHAMTIPLIASIVGSPSVEVDVSGNLTTFASTDELLNSYPGMRGIKTGYTYGAGRAFLGCATRGGQTLYVVVLGTESNDARWSDTIALLNWGFSHCVIEELASASSQPLGYMAYEDRFGWSVSTSIGLDVEPLVDPLTYSSEVSGASLTTLSDALVGTDDVVAQITWTDESGGTVASRTIETGSQIVATVTFGVASDVFYGADRF